MAAWKLALALACGNTVVLKPAEIHTAHRAQARRVAAGSRAPRWRRQHRHRCGCHGRGGGQPSDVNKVAFTGSTHAGKRIQRATAGSGNGSPRARRQAAIKHHLRRRHHRPAVEGASSTASTSTRATCCAGEPPFVEEAGTKGQGGACGGGGGHRAINREQLGTINKHLKLGQSEGAGDAKPPRPARQGLRVPPTLFSTWQSARIAQEEIRPCALNQSRPSAPWTRAIRNLTTRPTASAPAWGRTRAAKIQPHQQIARGHLGQHLQQVRFPTSPFGGYKERRQTYKAGWGRT